MRTAIFLGLFLIADAIKQQAPLGHITAFMIIVFIIMDLIELVRNTR